MLSSVGTESAMVAPGGWGERRMRSQRVMGFLFCRVKGSAGGGGDGSPMSGTDFLPLSHTLTRVN